VNYGICQFTGLGSAVNYVEAGKYLKIAADHGDSIGQLMYGLCLFDGLGVLRDEANAIRFFQLSADQNNAVAQVNLGFCLHEGIGVCRDYVRAAPWFNKAANQGMLLVNSIMDYAAIEARVLSLTSSRPPNISNCQPIKVTDLPNMAWQSACLVAALVRRQSVVPISNWRELEDRLPMIGTMFVGSRGRRK
jgi:hypothetical protein